MKLNNKSKFSHDELVKLYTTRSEMLRYRNNKICYWFCLLAICTLVAAFCTVYGYIRLVDSLTGIDILLNIIALLLTFMAAEGAKAYQKKWGYISFGLAAWHLIHIYYPIIIHNQLISGSDNVLDTMRMTIVIILYAISATLMIAAGIITLIRSQKLSDYLNGKIVLPKSVKGND